MKPRRYMSKHTPGPWTQEDDYAVVMGKFRMTDLRYSGATTSEAIANAHLIAAAPELLAFAQWFLANRDGPGRSMAEAAVKKAVGDA
jgi:hypothetical protein